MKLFKSRRSKKILEQNKDLIADIDTAGLSEEEIARLEASALQNMIRVFYRNNLKMFRASLYHYINIIFFVPIVNKHFMVLSSTASKELSFSLCNYAGIFALSCKKRRQKGHYTLV